MSFARFSNRSDIYLYEEHPGKLVCECCHLLSSDGHWNTVYFKYFREVELHLLDHKRAGHKIEKYTIKLIRKGCRKEIEKGLNKKKRKARRKINEIKTKN